MNELELIDIHIKNWIKIVFIISTIHVLIARIKLGHRFQYFLAFWNIHRYFYFVSGKRISSPININFDIKPSKEALNDKTYSVNINKKVNGVITNLEPLNRHFFSSEMIFTTNKTLRTTIYL